MSQLPHARGFRDLMEKADSFCGDPSSALHESVAEYYTSTTETDD